jgi:cytoskeletal protein CcmA (bactofilin family)
MAAPLKSAAIETRPIVCPHCRKSQAVGRSAMTVPCRFCHKNMVIEDVLITGYTAKRVIETCGKLVIEQKGDVTVNHVFCAELILAGKLKGNVICIGPVTIANTGHLRGDIAAASVDIAPGAKVQGACQIAPPA